MDMIERPSPNFNDRLAPISMVVLHYTGMESGEAALQRLCDSDAQVSAHYLVEEEGRVFRLVDEAKRAWHAGRAHWRGISDVNSASVGIEIVNPGHEFGYRPFPEAQMDAVVRLTGEVVRRHRIERANVVGHSDVAPARKQDPGELFDWERLARRRLALARPVAAHADPHWTDAGFLLALERFGYDVESGLAATIAFQRRFRPEIVDGVIDGQTRAILLQLLLDRERKLAT